MLSKSLFKWLSSSACSVVENNSTINSCWEEDEMMMAIDSLNITSEFQESSSFFCSSHFSPLFILFSFLSKVSASFLLNCVVREAVTRRWARRRSSSHSIKLSFCWIKRSSTYHFHSSVDEMCSIHVCWVEEHWHLYETSPSFDYIRYQNSNLTR